jgi:hypothetical protein
MLLRSLEENFPNEIWLDKPEARRQLWKPRRR